MLNFLTKRTIGRRVSLAFAAICVLLAVVAGAGLLGSARGSSIAAQTEHLHALRDEVFELRYLDADVSGWQAYLYVHALVDGPAQTVATDNSTLVGLNASRAAGYDMLATLNGQDLSPAEQASLATVTTQWQDYFDITDKMLALIGAGTGESMDAAYVILVKDLDTAWTVLLDSTAVLTDQVNGRIATLGEQADSAAANARFTVLVAGGLAIALAIALGAAMSRSIVRPLRRCADALKAMATGDLTVTADATGRDEVGDMARALATAQAALRSTLSGVAETARAVAVAAEGLSIANTEVANGSDESSAQAGVVAAAADQVSRNVQTVAAGAEQMGASIREIAQNANEAAKVAARATDVVVATNTTVSKLGESSVEIGAVVKTITKIAEQTNLLALNATIEAARAGEAGKGFAVVAGEVKELARETARATEEITRRVEAIQVDTTDAVAAMDEIGLIIASINDFQLTIASAVEEQTATTNEMSRSVTEAATGSVEIASNITGVAQSAASASQKLEQMGTSVDELAHLSGDLHFRVSAFTY
ncbi:MAG: methyl-accepting chemotaxis protein [Rhodoglobus sp.]